MSVEGIQEVFGVMHGCGVVVLMVRVVVEASMVVVL